MMRCDGMGDSDLVRLEEREGEKEMVSFMRGKSRWEK